MRTHPWVGVQAITLALLLAAAGPCQAQQAEKSARDFARLMPESSLAYAEMNYPKMTRELLPLIKSSALNDYAAFRDDLYKRLKIDGVNEGFSLPSSAFQALVLTPEFLDEVGRINGFAVAVTGVKAGQDGPEPSYIWAIDPGTSNIVPLIVRDICTLSSSMKSVRTVEGVRVNQWFQLDKRIEAARQNIQKVQGAMKSYLREHEKLDSLEDLVTSNPPLLRDKQVLIDPWGKPYRYEVKDGRATVWSNSPMGKITSTAGPKKAKYAPVGPVLAVMPGLILVGSDAETVSDVIRREMGLQEKAAAPILADLPEFQQYTDIRKNRQLFCFFNLAMVENTVKANPVATVAIVEARTLLGLDSCKELAIGAWLERSNPHLELVAGHDARKPTALARMLSTRTIDPRVLHFVPDDAFITITGPLFKEPGDYPRLLESLQVAAARTKHASNDKKTASAPENPIQHLVRQIGTGLATPQGKELASSIHSITLAAVPGTRSGILAHGILELKDEATAKAFMDLAPSLFGKGRKAKVQKIGKHTIYTVPVDDKGLETDLWGARFYWYWGEQSYGRHGNIVVLAPSPEMVARALQAGATNGGFAAQPDVAKALTQAKDANGMVVWSGRNIVKAGLKEARRLSTDAKLMSREAALAEAELAEALKKQKLEDQLRFTRPPMPTLEQELLRHYPQQLKKITADLNNVMRDLPAGLLTATARSDRLTISGSQSGLQLRLPRLIDVIVKWDLSRPNLAKLKQSLDSGRLEFRPSIRGDHEEPIPSSQEPPRSSTPNSVPRPGSGNPPPKSPPDRPEPREPEAYQRDFPSFERQRRAVEIAIDRQQMLATLPVPKEFVAARDRVTLQRLPAQDYDKEVAQTRSRIEEQKKGSGEDTAKNKEEIKRLEDYVKSLQGNRQTGTERDNQLESLRARLAELEPSSEKAARRVRAARDLLDSRKTFLDVEAEEHGSTTDTAKRLRAEMEWLGSELGSARRAGDKLSNKIAQHRKKIDELEEPLNKALENLKKVMDYFDRQAVEKHWERDDTFRSLPIIDAFSSPMKTRQLPLDDLLIDYSFKGARSFDRAHRVQWEYKIMTAAEVRDLGKNNLGAGLNRLGEHGWELVGIDKKRYFLKRSQGADLRQR